MSSRGFFQIDEDDDQDQGQRGQDEEDSWDGDTDSLPPPSYFAKKPIVVDLSPSFDLIDLVEDSEQEDSEHEQEEEDEEEEEEELVIKSKKKRWNVSDPDTDDQDERGAGYKNAKRSRMENLEPDGLEQYVDVSEKNKVRSNPRPELGSKKMCENSSFGQADENNPKSNHVQKISMGSIHSVVGNEKKIIKKKLSVSQKKNQTSPATTTTTTTTTAITTTAKRNGFVNVQNFNDIVERQVEGEGEEEEDEDEEPFLICGFDLGTRQAGFSWLDEKRMIVFSEQVDFHVIDGFEYKPNPELFSYQCHTYAMKWRARFMKTIRFAPEKLLTIPGANKNVGLFGHLFMQTIYCLYPHIQRHWVDPRRVRTTYGISVRSTSGKSAKDYAERKALAPYKMYECMSELQFARLQKLYRGSVDVYDSQLLACYSAGHYEEDRDAPKLMCKGPTTKPGVMSSGLLSLTSLPEKGRPRMDFQLESKKKTRGSTIQAPCEKLVSVIDASLARKRKKKLERKLLRKQGKGKQEVEEEQEEEEEELR